jgi:hypothetical protein
MIIIDWMKLNGFLKKKRRSDTVIFYSSNTRMDKIIHKTLSIE